MAAPKLPAWVEQARQTAIPAAYTSAPAVVLNDVSEVEVARSGKIESRTYYAVRIQNVEGREYASATLSYNLETDKVRELNAWLILPNGEVRTYKERDFARREEKLSRNVYHEGWERSLDLESAAAPGSIFAWSARLEEDSIFPQLIRYFEKGVPVIQTRLQLELPEGWRLTTTPVNNPTYTYQEEGLRHRWIASYLDAVEYEEWQPDVAFPFLGINLFPAEQDQRRARMETYTDWNSIAAFHVPVMDGAATPDEAVRAKVLELTKDCSTQWQKIQAVSRFCQAVSYASIALDLSKGGGYRPYPAPTVLSRNYGDCKDKTALLRAMLSCLGVESYAVACLVSDSDAVTPLWASPMQFNHCITALRAPEGIETGAAVDHPDLGKLLIFDPTNPYVPVGSISNSLAGSFALVIAPEVQRLQAIPTTLRSVKLELKGTLTPRGGLTAHVEEVAEGHEAVLGRRLYRNHGSSHYEQGLLNWMRSELSATRISAWDVTDDLDSDRFTVGLDLEAPSFGRALGSTMMIIKPFINSNYMQRPDLGEKRAAPIRMPYFSTENAVEIALPEGYVVDELPAPLLVEDTFGRVEVEYREENGALIAHRKVSLNGATVPATELERLNAFFDAYQKAGQGRVVIKRL
ncbi:MAG: DUF3857 domain-containing protein [Verrucomicrobiota bacterium JB022]|nr:DUF3857 domain-containing protein [Verrucomicrobiota bacterium JB022]